MSDKKTPAEEGKEVAQNLMQNLNYCDNKEFCKAFVETVTRDHRTLQQSFGRLLQGFIFHYAKQYEEKNFDLRNEALCKWAHEIVELTRDNPLPFI